VAHLAASAELQHAAVLTVSLASEAAVPQAALAPAGPQDVLEEQAAFVEHPALAGLSAAKAPVTIRAVIARQTTRVVRILFISWTSLSQES